MSDIASSSQTKTRSIIPLWLRGSWGTAGLVMLVYVIFFIIWTQFHWGGEENVSLIGNLAILPPMLLDAIMSWRVASQKQLDLRLRRAWFLLGLGTFSFFLGEATWTYVENVLHIEPFPSLADAFFLLSYPLVFSGLLTMPGARLKPRERTLFWFNLLIMLTSSSMLVGYFLIVPTASANNSDPLSMILATAYPVSSLILLGGAMYLLLRLPESDTRAALRFLLPGMGFFLASDLAFGYTSLIGTYAAGNWVDAGWHVAQVFMILAALRQLHQGLVPSTRPWWLVVLQGFVKLLPFLTTLMGYGLVFYIALTHFSESVEWIFLAGALLTGLILGRQVFVTGYSSTSIRTKLIFTFLLVCVSSLELMSIFTYFFLRSHPTAAWQVFSVVTTLVVILSTAAAIFLAKRFVAPITRLTEVARQIAAGDLAAKAQVESSDEIGMLAGTFNTMLDTLSQTQGELRQAEVFAHSIFSSLRAHVAVLDRHGQIISVNKAWENFASANGDPDLQSTCVGINYLKTLEKSADDMNVAQVLSGLKDVLNGTKAELVVEYPCHSPTEKRWFLMHATPLLSDQGGAVVSHTNITESKMAQQALEESEERYRRLVDYSPDMIAVHDREKIIFINPIGVTLLGAKSMDEIIGQPAINIVPPQDREIAQKDMERTFANPEATPLLQRTVQRMDGGSFDAEFRAIPILYEGKPAIQLVMRDITERKRLEEQWQKFKQGIERSHEAVFMTDVDGAIRYVNPAFEKLYGYVWDEAVGQTPRILKSGKLSLEVYEHFWGKMLAKGTVKGEIVNRTKDGQLIQIEGSNGPILDEQGNLTGFLAVHRDVTERKRSEEQIHQNAARAEALVRVASILNSQLDLCSVAQAICEETARALAVPVVTVRLVNEQNDGMYLLSQIGRQIEHVPAIVPLARPAYDAMIQCSSSLIMLPEWNQAENDRNAELYAGLNLRIGVHASIVHNGRLIGMLSLKTIGEPREFTSDESDLIKGLADQAGLAISNAQLFAEVERQKGELELRVAERTTELNILNQRLQDELSEREQLFLSLGESESRFRLLFEASPDAILLIDPNQNDGSWPIVDCNEVACRMNGYTRQELIGQSVDLINTSPGNLAERGEYLEFLRAHGVLLRDGVHRHKDGHVFPIEVSSSLISYANRELVLGIDRDITERKQAELALQHAKDAAVTSQLVAEEASRAKSEFLSRMSHELRTPMNAILGFAQLLEMSQKEPLSSTQKDRVKQISKGGQHLLDLINEILDISRIEANRMQVSPEPVSVRESVQEVLDLSVPLAVKRHIQIVTKLGGLDANPFVLADRQRLKQVLLNLLSNAVKYNYDGGSVIITCQKASSKKWRISVTDSGPGISQENLARLFVAFERLNDDQQNVEGTGLGLVLAKRLVELMHGEMGVESTVGRGSTFWLELPTTESPLARAHLANTTGRLPALSATARTILYVEDNVANFELIQQVLADYSQIKLLWAPDARAGLETAREHQPNLILLDLHLGGSNGADLLRQLKQDQGTSEIPVVVVSADATAGQVHRLIALGAHTYLTKPLDVKQFIQLTEELLGEREV